MGDFQARIPSALRPGHGLFRRRKAEADPSIVVRMMLNSFLLFSFQPSTSCSLTGGLLYVPVWSGYSLSFPMCLILLVDLAPLRRLLPLESHHYLCQFKTRCSRISYLIDVRVPNRLMPLWVF